MNTLNTIGQIRLLRKIISQKGACQGLRCSECKATLFRSAKYFENNDCRKLHHELGLLYTPKTDEENEDIVQLARKELRAILLEKIRSK
jgi:hypothetical protein